MTAQVTPAVDYKKALEELRYAVKNHKGGYCDGRRNGLQITLFDDTYQALEQALQPCAEAMTEDEYVAEINKWIHLNFPQNIWAGIDIWRFAIKALAKSGHLKVKSTLSQPQREG